MSSKRDKSFFVPQIVADSPEKFGLVGVLYNLQTQLSNFEITLNSKPFKPLELIYGLAEIHEDIDSNGRAEFYPKALNWFGDYEITMINDNRIGTCFFTKDDPETHLPDKVQIETKLSCTFIFRLDKFTNYKESLYFLKDFLKAEIKKILGQNPNIEILETYDTDYKSIFNTFSKFKQKGQEALSQYNTFPYYSFRMKMRVLYAELCYLPTFSKNC